MEQSEKNMLIKLYNKYEELSQPKKAAIWFLLCNIFLKGLSFFTTPLFTRILSTAEYGKLSVFTSVEQLILVIATWEIPIGPYQRGLFKYKDDVSVFTFSAQIFSNILTFFSFLVIFVFFNRFYDMTGMSAFATVILMLYLWFQPAYSCWFYRKRIRFDYKKSVVATIFITLAGTAVPLIAVLTIKKTAELKFIFTLLPTIIIYFGFYIAGFQHLHPIRDRRKICQYWSFFLHFTPPLVIHAISYYILGQADRIMIAKMDSEENAAIYSIAYTIAGMAIVVQSAVTQVLVPWIYQNIEKKNYDVIKKKSTILFGGVGIIYLVFILISPEIIKIMYPKPYYESIWCIPPIAMGSYFMLLYTMFVNVESYFEETKYIAYVSVFCALVNIILNFFGIQYVGYRACAYSTLICYILFAVGHYLFMKKVLRKHLKGRQIYDMKAILKICTGLIAAMAIIIFLYQYFFLRYGSVLLLILLCFMNFNNERSRLSFLKMLKKRDRGG